MATRLIGHHFIQVGAQLPMCLLPVLVAIRLSTTANAYFYVTWMVGGIFFLISPSVAQSLVAEGGHDPAAFAQRLRSASRMLVVLLAVPMVVVFFGGHLILSTFGHNYAAHATSLLRILVIAAIPDAFTNIYVSAMRVCDRLGRAAALNISMGCGAIGLSWVLLPGMGIAGAGWAWLIAQSVGAVVALIDLRRQHRQDASSLAQSADKPARDTAAEVNFAGVQAEA